MRITQTKHGVRTTHRALVENAAVCIGRGGATYSIMTKLDSTGLLFHVHLSESEVRRLASYLPDAKSSELDK